MPFGISWFSLFIGIALGLWVVPRFLPKLGG